MQTPTQRMYNRSQDKIAQQIETLKSLLDGHAQAVRITEQHAVTVAAVEDKLDELIEMLGGEAALR